nr:immunoglobulin light chain junction region [Macaca mulatta]MOW42972.1 immunoglobulin light chain junction region [Macaca mulatta]
CQKYGDSPFTF